MIALDVNGLQIRAATAARSMFAGFHTCPANTRSWGQYLTADWSCATGIQAADEDDTVVLVNTGTGNKDDDVLRSHLKGQGI